MTATQYYVQFTAGTGWSGARMRSRPAWTG